MSSTLVRVRAFRAPRRRVDAMTLQEQATVQPSAEPELITIRVLTLLRRLQPIAWRSAK